MIAVVDSGGANLASVVAAFDRLGAKTELTGDPERVRRGSRVVLPGVGAAGSAMAVLRRRGLDDCLKELTQPVLGICLGMQLLFRSSEEGPTPCLGLIAGDVARLAPAGLSVPHMGWNEVAFQGSSALFKGLADGAFFYFVHSFAAAPGPWVRATCGYGGEVTAAVAQDNFFGVQFHPERSAKAGARVLENFLAL